MGIELLDASASSAIENAAAEPEVSRTFKAGDAPLISEAERHRYAEAAASMVVQVIPPAQWKVEPVVEHDLSNATSQPISTISIDPNAVVGTVIIATPATGDEPEVPQQLDPVVQGGVVALNLMVSAAATVFESFSTMLRKVFFFI